MSILADKDVNGPVAEAQQDSGAKKVQSMEYHRQVFQSKAQEPSKAYVSPSDNMLSPCTTKINALRNKQVSKAKPRSLFAQASVKKLQGESALNATYPL